MMTNSVMFDPTAELNPVEKQILPRLESLSGATIGLLDISKPRGKRITFQLFWRPFLCLL